MSYNLESFNPAQKAAVEYCDGPSLVIAGAGSGKTRVLTHKIAYLMSELGLQPWEILALTFTNKAANEMKVRIGKIVGDEQTRYLWMGTFHSIFLRILRAEHEAIGFSSSFTIYDTADSKSLIKTILKEMALDEKVYKPGDVLGRISNAKNRLVTAEQYVNTPDYYKMDQQSRMPHLGSIYMRYSNRCRQSDAMDFDDILLYTYFLFDKFEDIRRKYVERFHYVLVDEYQDTNFAQHRIVWQLTKERQRVCVVGDDAQSIYSFRGANIDNILSFNDLYDGVRMFKLEQNYRSTQTIVNAANSLISKNDGQIKKNVFSENDLGELITVSEASSDVEESIIVYRQISNIRKKENADYSDFAILYRTNAQSRVFEETLRKNGVPYKIFGGLSFYQRKEIKDIIAYFRLVVNNNDEEAFKRIINYPARGIGDTTLKKIGDCANVNDVSYWAVISEPDRYGLSVAKSTMNRIDQFREMIEGFSKMAETENADDVGRHIVKESGIIGDIYSDTSPEGLARQENVEELVNGMSDFVANRQEEGNEHFTLVDYLSEVSLVSDLDSDKNDDGPKVTLMTIHSAKGLEFPTVFVVGLENNLFPSQMAGSSIREMEEERRLFYVAITRAERHCFLSYAKSRYRYGKLEMGTPSPFLSDIDPGYLDRKATATNRYRGEAELPWKRRRSMFDDEPEYMRGERSGSTGAYGSSRMSGPGTRGTSRPEASPMPRINNSGISGFTPRTSQSSFVPPSPEIRRVSRVTDSNVASAAPKSPEANASIAVGKHIEHQRFGVGVVMKIEGSGDQLKAVINFDNLGTKQLLLKFARFKVLD